ncbi:hypothetical protein [Curtobacterium sp. MCLR17_054]|uniref:hypothetical protein n=1 Tax=Curtobacterium sp. MCLR17_054 TaxID=2175632 RepID=UPI0011B3ACB3|nr:hypothetical protein [Curtobacterium sp. MCLR17_054]WIE70318.1 hypothetical protein DEJ08_018270 [Curtobacterium sp. MCLR17_054]
MSLTMITRGASFMDNTEESMVSAALRVLDDPLDRAPILPDPFKLIRDGHPRVRGMAYDGGDATYRRISQKLEASLARPCSEDGTVGLAYGRRRIGHPAG